MSTLSRRLLPLAALLVAATVCTAAAAILTRMIEQRSYADVTNILRLGGYDWAEVHTDGLQVDLTGTAPSEALRFRAITLASRVVDSARVVDHMRVAEQEVVAPAFSIEILRNEGAVSLIGLVPGRDGPGSPQEALVARVRQIAGVTDVTDLLNAADYPVPDGWQQAVEYGIDALARLPRSKLSITAGHLSVSAMSDSAAARGTLETALKQAAPDGLDLSLDISAPRPAITPFSLRFLIDPKTGAKFDSCSADTAAARDAILAAAKAAGLKQPAPCTIGLGAPSPRWGEAAARAIKALADLGAGSVTFADGDVTLVAPPEVPKDRFDTVVGGLERDLPDAFSLHPVLTEPEKPEGSPDEKPEFTASLGASGAFSMHGRIGNALDRSVIDSYAKALFGAGQITDGTRLDQQIPKSWSIRVMTALDALKRVETGAITVRPDYVSVSGKTGLPEASTEIAKLFSAKLGQGARFDINVTYDKTLDRTLGLPTAQECVTQINAAIKTRQITFAPGSATIDADAAATIDKIAKLMKNCSGFKMEVGGHTDSQGRTEMNLALSQQRAEAVIDALMQRRVLVGNLTAHGYGESEPIADNSTEQGREANRRIEFKLIKPKPDPTTEADAGAAAKPANPANTSDPGSAAPKDAAAGAKNEQN